MAIKYGKPPYVLEHMVPGAVPEEKLVPAPPGPGDVTEAEIRRHKLAKRMTRTANAIEMGEISEGRVLVSLRLSPEVIAFFKALGPGWTGKINDVLLNLVRKGATEWLK